MNGFVVRLLSLLIGYCFGIFQTAYIYGKTKGVDIRTMGSGNAGSTNVLRNFGAKAGVIVFIGDFAKCVLAYLIVGRIFGGSGVPARLLGLYGAVGAVVGHCFPFYMQFRGGKGIACLIGLMAAFSPVLLLVGLAVFLVVVMISHYVSLSSLLSILAFLIATIVSGMNGAFAMTGPELTEMYIVLACVVALAWFQHRENIKRLISGTERKTYLFGKKDK